MTVLRQTAWLLFVPLLLCDARAAADVKGWPKGVKEIQYKSAADDSMQPALFYAPDKKGSKPLLVALHTWSGYYKQAGGQTAYARWCNWCSSQSSKVKYGLGLGTWGLRSNLRLLGGSGKPQATSLGPFFRCSNLSENRRTDRA